jgi:hypothetical protein
MQLLMDVGREHFIADVAKYGLSVNTGNAW